MYWCWLWRTINDNNKILLVKRSSSSRTESGTWSRPGGQVEFGETVEEAVRREIKEETDVDNEYTRKSIMCLKNSNEFPSEKFREIVKRDWR